MPIYEYECLVCKERFSLLQNMGCSERETACPNCSSADIRKLISSFCCSSGSEKNVATSLPSGGFSGSG